MLSCQIAAFEAMGGTPGEILYDRMNTAVIGEYGAGGVAYNNSLVALLNHYRVVPTLPGSNQGQGRATLPLRASEFLPGSKVSLSRRPQQPVR